MPRPRSRTKTEAKAEAKAETLKAETKAEAKLTGAGCPALLEGSDRTYCGVTV